jgi:DNA-binding beta-propeller fold protein YncE
MKPKIPRQRWAPLLALLIGVFWCTRYAGAAGEATPAAPPLPAPQWIGVTALKGKAILNWIPNPLYAGVKVFRRIKGQGSSDPLGTVSGGGFTDTSVTPGVSYLYRLVGVDGAGRESKASPEAGATIPSQERRAATPPQWEGALQLDRGIGLKWSQREDEDVIAVNVYRKAPPDQEFRLLGSSRGTSLLDSAVEPGTTYVYVLTALDSSFRETAYSAELVVRFQPPVAVERAKELAWRTRRTRLVAMVTAGDGPLFRPSDVAVAPRSGLVYLADGGNNRILVFDGSGRYLRTLGGAKGGALRFQKLLGVSVDQEETVLAVDAGAGAVVALSPLGAILRRIDAASLFPLLQTGIIDAVAGPDGRVFVVDNFNHQVFIAGRDGLAGTFGKLGYQAGEFSAPTFCAMDAAGQLYLADALNGRVQVFDSTGGFVRSFGQYAQGPGGLGRPKGVALSPAGEVYVADSWQNVIEVFDASGQFVAALTDEQDRPLDVGSPNGIAIDARGRIYIAERLSNRLQIREPIDAP